jgi:hypothetical protein
MEDHRMRIAIKYFVSYSFILKDGRNGFGHCDIDRYEPYKDSIEIQEDERKIAEQSGWASVIILNFTRYEDQ